MKAEEIMIGNWVKYGDFYMQMDTWRLKNEIENPNTYLPIPITPEILEKAGFVLVKTLSNKEGYYNRKEYPQLQIYGGKVFVGSPCLNHVQYLHQLQNLYFSLVGSELPITL